MPPSRFPELTRRYIFNGHASALGGQIYDPEAQKGVIDISCGSSALGVAGGVARSSNNGGGLTDTQGRRIERSDITFTSSETFSEGRYTDERKAIQVVRHTKFQDELATRTTTRVTLNGLRVGGAPTFSAGVIHAELTGYNDGPDREPRYAISEDTRFETLAVTDPAGKVYGLTVEIKRGVFCSRNGKAPKGDTRAKLALAAAKDPDIFPRTYVGRETRRAQAQSKTFKLPKAARIVSLRGVSYATIVEKISWADAPYPESEINQNIVQIPELGLIFFGELLVSPAARRLTMVRFELGSDDGGYVDGVDVASAGSWYP